MNKVIKIFIDRKSIQLPTDVPNNQEVTLFQVRIEIIKKKDDQTQIRKEIKNCSF